jgi:rSAM/selenodomain-associated transferase 2
MTPGPHAEPDDQTPSPPFGMEERAGERRRSPSSRVSKSNPSPQPSPRSFLAGRGSHAPRSISVVIPVLNEATALPETIRRAGACPEVCEIIVVDGGSTDGTPGLAEQLGCRVFASPPGRGAQMRLGAEQAAGDVVLLLHADTHLPPHAGRAILDALSDPTTVGGGFWKVFDQPRWFMRGSRARCWLRLVLGGRILGDQGIFLRRDVLGRIDGVPDWPLMEEYELCRRLRRIGRLALAPATVVTSARRFRERGGWRTYLLMAWVTLRFHLGAKPEDLRRLYERK